MSFLFIVLALVSLWVYSHAGELKKSLYGLVPATALERLVCRFIDSQLWFSIGFALLAVLSVLE